MVEGGRWHIEEAVQYYNTTDYGKQCKYAENPVRVTKQWYCVNWAYSASMQWESINKLVGLRRSQAGGSVGQSRVWKRQSSVEGGNMTDWEKRIAQSSWPDPDAYFCNSNIVNSIMLHLIKGSDNAQMFGSHNLAINHVNRLTPLWLGGKTIF